MNSNKIDINLIKEKIKQGLDLAFIKLLKQKKSQDGIIVLSINGQIKKVKASEYIN